MSESIKDKSEMRAWSHTAGRHARTANRAAAKYPHEHITHFKTSQIISNPFNRWVIALTAYEISRNPPNVMYTFHIRQHNGYKVMCKVLTTIFASDSISLIAIIFHWDVQWDGSTVFIFSLVIGDLFGKWITKNQKRNYRSHPITIKYWICVTVHVRARCWILVLSILVSQPCVAIEAGSQRRYVHFQVNNDLYPRTEAR